MAATFMSPRHALAKTEPLHMCRPHASSGGPPVRLRGFVDRRDAGQQLADALGADRGRDVLVMGIPRGGVAVAAEIARSLGADLDVVVARKVGAPSQPELALGAVTADGKMFMNSVLARELGVSLWMFRILAGEQRAEARRQERRLRGQRPAARISGRTVILVDDGLATGATVRAAIRSVRQAGPACLVVAVPVAAQPTCDAVRAEADELVCLLAPDPFIAVGVHYVDFQPIADEDVQRLLAEGAPSST